MSTCFLALKMILGPSIRPRWLPGHKRRPVDGPWLKAAAWEYRAPMPPIVIATFADCLAGGYTFHVNCRSCERRTILDLARLVELGRGHESYVRRRFRCGVCGGPGEAIIRA